MLNISLILYIHLINSSNIIRELVRIKSGIQNFQFNLYYYLNYAVNSTNEQIQFFL